MRSRWSGGVRLLLLLSLAACSDSPLDFGKRAYPEARTPLTDLARDTEPEELPDVRYLAVYKTTPPRPEQVLAQIGPEGGSLRAGDFEIIVPAGAVARATLFRIRLPAETGATKHAYAEFNASSAFLLPVTIRCCASASEIMSNRLVSHEICRTKSPFEMVKAFGV